MKPSTHTSFSKKLTLLTLIGFSLSCNSPHPSQGADLDKEYLSFVENLESEREQLKNSLLSQIPLFKESIKAKFSKL